MNNKQNEFLELFEPCRKNLSRFCNAIAGTREDAKDLASETIAEAYNRFDKLRDKKAFVSFLFSIASRINRRTKHKMSRFTGIAEGQDWKVSETSADTKLDIKILYEALAKLPLKQKESIILFEISGFSIEEIKDIQGGTLSGVKSRLKRGREKLKELLTENSKESKAQKVYKVQNFSNNQNGLKHERQRIG